MIRRIDQQSKNKIIQTEQQGLEQLPNIFQQRVKKTLEEISSEYEKEDIEEKEEESSFYKDHLESCETTKDAFDRICNIKRKASRKS